MSDLFPNRPSVTTLPYRTVADIRQDAQTDRDVRHLLKALDRINLAACYASEENTAAQAETLLLIGQIARGEVQP